MISVCVNPVPTIALVTGSAAAAVVIATALRDDDGAPLRDDDGNLLFPDPE